MSEENTAVEAKPEIDWKLFSQKLLFEGVIPAAKYAVDFTENEIDDTAVAIIEKVGEFLLPSEEKVSE